MEIHVRFCEYQILSLSLFNSLWGSFPLFMRICAMKLQEKGPYIAKAEKRKVEYNKTMQAYNKRLVSFLSV